MFKHLPHFLCAFPELFLKSANQFVILTFCVCEIVVGQLGVLLFDPSSTVRKIEWLSLNDLRKDKRALALHFVA